MGISVLSLFFFNYLPSGFLLLILKMKQFFNRDIRQYQPLLYSQPKKERDYGSKKKIVFLSLRSFTYYNLAVFEQVLGDCFREEGAEVKSLLCNNVLKTCDFLSKGARFSEGLCRKCQLQKDQFMSYYPSDYIFFSDYISKEKVSDLKDWVLEQTLEQLKSIVCDSVNIFEHAYDSLVKYNRNGVVDWSDPDQIQQYRHLCHQALVSLEVSKELFKQESPTHFVSLHGVYVSWGVMKEYLEKKGVKIVIHAKSVEEIGSMLFYKGGYSNDIADRSIWELFKKRPLSENKKELVSSFMKRKMEKTSFAYQLYYKRKKEKRKIGRAHV